MSLLDNLEQWTNLLWSWIDWIWAAGWILAGVLGTHLIWWQRHNRLTEREKQVREQMAQIGSRHRETRRQTEEIGRREETLKKLEERLRSQTEQLMPQIEQIRGWLDQMAGKERPMPTADEGTALAGDLGTQAGRPPEATSLQ